MRDPNEQPSLFDYRPSVPAAPQSLVPPPTIKPDLPAEGGRKIVSVFCLGRLNESLYTEKAWESLRRAAFECLCSDVENSSVTPDAMVLGLLQTPSCETAEVFRAQNVNYEQIRGELGISWDSGIKQMDDSTEELLRVPITPRTREVLESAAKFTKEHISIGRRIRSADLLMALSTTYKIDSPVNDCEAAALMRKRGLTIVGIRNVLANWNRLALES